MGHRQPWDPNRQMSQSYYTERQAAAHLGLSPNTLAKWRCQGAGPRFHRFGGAIRYARSDLDSFAARSLSTAGGAQ
jgi:hypothetical protein